MTDTEQVFVATLFVTAMYGAFMTWLVVGMSATIRSLRERLGRAMTGDPYRSSETSSETAPRMRLSLLRPLRRVAWFWLQDLPNGDYSPETGHWSLDDVFAFFGRVLLTSTAGLTLGIMGSGVIEQWRSGWSMFAIPVCVFGFWLSRWFVRAALYADDKDNYAALQRWLDH